MPTPLLSLLRRVALRCRFVSLAARLRVVAIAGAAVVVFIVLLARLLNLFPLEAALPFLGILGLPVIAVLALSPAPHPGEVARLVDAREGTKDLFLTAVLAKGADGFAPIVAAQAAERAASIEPRRVVPFHWRRGMRDILLAALCVACTIAWLPQLDPLRKQAARERTAENQRRLAEMTQATTVRREELAQVKDRDPEEVKAALARLADTFQQAKPNEKENSLKELAARQKELGELWRRMNRPELRANLAETPQSFGAADPQRFEEWRKPLQQGDTSALKQELREIRDAAQSLAGKEDSAEKRAGQQQLAQRLKELSEAMREMAGSSQIDEALQRALTQLDLARLEELSKASTEGALDSLQLGEEEIDQLGQALKDGQALEEALKNLQMAKQLAEAGKLDGSEGQGGKMSDYARLFEGKMGDLGERAGLSREAPLGQGPGTGAVRPEDESAKTRFKTEKAGSQLAGGKLLLEWKTKQVGETGARTEEYQAAVRGVQQGVAEAIQQEQVPPGHHEAIQRYFDTLPAK